MKVSLCSQCRITPEITPTILKCPKCGRMACGKDLVETVEKWNNGDFSESGKKAKVVIKDEELKAEKVEEKVEETPVVEEKPEEKPEKAKKDEKKPIRKPVKKPVKKGAK